MSEPPFDHARKRLASGDVEGARGEARQLLGRTADPVERAGIELLLAACARHLKEYPTALQHVRAAIASNPDHALAHYLEAELLETQHDLAAAVASVRRAIELDPSFTPAWFYLGLLSGQRGEIGTAAQAFERTVRLDPGHVRGWNKLGIALRSLGRHLEAEQAFERAMTLKPDYGPAIADYATALRDRGDVGRAEAILRDALARPQPGGAYRPLLVLLAGITRQRGLVDEAAQLYWRAIQAAPNESGNEWFQLGWVLAERGDTEAARDAYARSHALDRRQLRAWFGRHLVLPVICETESGVDATRQRYAEGLRALAAEVDQAVTGLKPDEVIDGLRWSNFFLAYHGRDDREFQSRYGSIVARSVAIAAPQWAAAPAAEPVRDRRIRVGFASAFLHEGTVGRYFRSWIVELPRERFEVFVYQLWSGADEVTAAIGARADVVRNLGGSASRPSLVAPIIRSDALDLLIYPELGMDVTCCAISALRLAPRQWCAWGHPVTSGQPTIDAFVSCATMEPQDAAEHYTERLLLLPGIGTNYTRPSLPADAAREAFGLPEDALLVLCPQSVWKIQPENDELFAQVLQNDANALLVLFAGRNPTMTDRFMRRLERCFAARGLAVRERVRVLPPVSHEDYLRLNLLCDFMLDTLHWSGGNTSLDALACGLPMVTLPGRFMRGRQSAAMLRLLGLHELVAADRAEYLAIASRLMSEPAWRDSLRKRIRAAHNDLFGRKDAVAALTALIESAVSAPEPHA